VASPDGTWSPGTLAWINVYYLRQYLLGLGAIESYGAGSLLIQGDLPMIGTSHVAMIGGVNPVRYSAHTNDRRLISLGGYNAYWHVKSYIP
jgi:hypothetical protein